ncbi:MAG TPA: phytanoyl-CoA dioxygenase family protein [Holophagaceae bacterium]|nr:phytanoyl-CoA dioxygenase family protein [Holophagaceae bacterium]
MGFAEELERLGWARLPERLPEAALEALVRRVPMLAEPSRRPVPLAPLNDWLATTSLPALMAELLGTGARPTRALLMAKGPGQAWAIDWHRDTTFAVAEPIEVPGFDGWVNKGPFYQVQAPREWVGRIRTLRIHLDSAGPEQGPLLVRSGSHAGEGEAPLEVPALRGEVLAMNPLLLHASEIPRDLAPRRVLHVEWAAFELPGGLRWAWF